MLRLSVLLLILLGASACGQKGDLYLPERESSELADHIGSANASENDSLGKS